MKTKNRLHGLTRWPSDEEKRWKLATTDVEFCLAMGRMLYPECRGVVPKELQEVWRVALRVLRDTAANN